MNITVILYIVFIIGGLAFIYLAFSQRSKAKKAGETWPTVPGVVTESRISSHTSHYKGRTSTQLTAQVKYEYQVNAQIYDSNRLGFGNPGSGKKKANAKIAEYPVGTPVTVHYYPADPSNAVLETKAYSFVSNLCLAAGMIAIGVFGLLL